MYSLRSCLYALIVILAVSTVPAFANEATTGDTSSSEVLAYRGDRGHWRGHGHHGYYRGPRHYNRAYYRGYPGGYYYRGYPGYYYRSPYYDRGYYYDAYPRSGVYLYFRT